MADPVRGVLREGVEKLGILVYTHKIVTIAWAFVRRPHIPFQAVLEGFSIQLIDFINK